MKSRRYERAWFGPLPGYKKPLEKSSGLFFFFDRSARRAGSSPVLFQRAHQTNRILGRRCSLKRARRGSTRLSSQKRKMKSPAGNVDSDRLSIHKAALRRQRVLVPLEAALERNCAAGSRGNAAERADLALPLWQVTKEMRNTIRNHFLI